MVAAEGGEQALREFEARRGEIALVVLDAVMPKLSGPETYRRMKALDPHVRVMFVSGYAPDSMGLADLVRQDGIPFLAKPFSPRVLAFKIREVLDQASVGC